MNKAEKQLLVQIISNVDEIKKVLSSNLQKKLKKSFKRIYANYFNLLEGVSNDK
jgi:ribosomal protein L18